MGKKVTGPQDINVRKMIRVLEKTKINVWKEVASYLKKARRKRVEANLGRLERITSNGETIVVPGKVLGTGMFSKNITIAALAWSESAKQKVESAGSKIITIEEVLESNPSGSNVKLIR
ncbi:MAG: 50S ribosomal protein L18e [Promethearchaeota archaeon]